MRAGEARGEHHLFAWLVVDGDTRATPSASLSRGLERFGEALLHVGANPQRSTTASIVCFLFLSSFGGSIELGDDAVDPRADETLATQFCETRAVFAFALADHRRQHHDARLAGSASTWSTIWLTVCAASGMTVIRAARLADACKQQAQVVVDFGDRADRRARVVRGRFLFDRDRRRQTFDVVDVGLFHHRQELPRIGRQRFDVAALAFRVQRIERQRRLSGPGQAGDDDSLSRGIVRSKFFRLWVRAPRSVMLSTDPSAQRKPEKIRATIPAPQGALSLTPDSAGAVCFRGTMRYAAASHDHRHTRTDPWRGASTKSF